MISDEELATRCQALKQMDLNIKARLNKIQQTLEGLPANGFKPNVPAPAPQRSLDDVVELVRPARLPASMRQALPGINVPYPGETWADLNTWRSRYGLEPVTPW